MTVAEGRVGRNKVEHQYVTLQWGRNLTVAEGAAGQRHSEFMEKLQWGRNLTVAEGSLMLEKAYPNKPGFNGAAT